MLSVAIVINSNTLHISVGRRNASALEIFLVEVNPVSARLKDKYIIDLPGILFLQLAQDFVCIAAVMVAGLGSFNTIFTRSSLFKCNTESIASSLDKIVTSYVPPC